MSWTTSLNVAQKFAERFGKEGTVYSTVLKPEEILAAYADDGEQEVLAKVDASRVEVV